MGCWGLTSFLEKNTPKFGGLAPTFRVLCTKCLVCCSVGVWLCCWGNPHLVYPLPSAPPILASAGCGDMNVINIMEGEQMKPEFLAINPFHHIPSMTDGSVNLGESGVPPHSCPGLSKMGLRGSKGRQNRWGSGQYSIFAMPPTQTPHLHPRAGGIMLGTSK